MGKSSQSLQPPAPTESADEARPVDPFAEIVALARSTTSKTRFLGEVLRCTARFFNSPYAALHVRYASEIVQDDCHGGPGDPNFWKGSVQEFLTESLAEVRSRAKLLKAKTGQVKVALLSVPVFDPTGPAIGAMALVVAPIDDDTVAPTLSRLEAVARFASFSASFLGATDRDSGTGGSSLHPTFARSARCQTTEELAFAITNELRNKLGCEQVALGLASRRRVKVISISGLDEVRKQSPGVVSLRSAMEECLDAAVPITYHPDGGWSSDGIVRAYRLHKQWHASAKGGAVASIPLKAGEHVVAILSMRGRSDRPLSPDQVEDLRAKVEPFAPALLLTQRASRGLWRHVTDSCRSGVEVLTTPGRVATKIALAAAAALLGWFCFGTMNYELSVPCVVTAAEVRHIPAPFDGVIAAAAVVAGVDCRVGGVWVHDGPGQGG